MFIIRNVIDYNLAYQLYQFNIDVFENESIKIPTPSLTEINDWLTKKYKILIRVHEYNSKYIYTIETPNYKIFGKIFYPKPEDALREGIVRYLKYKFFRKL